MSVRFGVNPIGWSNDDLRELGGKTPLETCLKEAKQAGYEGIELGHKFPREAKALKAVLSQAGLDLVSGWYSSELLLRDAKEEMKHLRAHLDLLKALGSNILIFAETSNATHGDRSKPLSKRPKLMAGDWREFGQRMTEVAEAVAKEGVALAYHHHMGTVVQSGEDIDAFMESTGNAVKLKAGDWREFGQRMTEVAETVAKEGVALAYHHHMGTVVQSGEDIDAFMESTGNAVKLLLDTGHATFGGADPVALARKYRPRIAHVHCKDVRKDVMAKAREKDWSFLDAVVEGCFTVPGDGMVNYPAFFKELPGYSGWLVVEAEQDPEKANPLKYATMGCTNLKRYAKDAKLA